MIEGFWLVQYEGIQGNGGGVAVFMNGRVMGGDTGYTYLGTYRVEDGGVIAELEIHNFLPGVPSVVGVVGDFKMRVEGMLEDGLIRAGASLVGVPGAGLRLRLTRICDLPGPQDYSR